VGSLRYRFQLPVFVSVVKNIKCINTHGGRERNLQLLLSPNMPHLLDVWLKEHLFQSPLLIS